MRTFIGAKLLSSKLAQPAIKPFEIYDSRLAGFTLRVQPTGVRSYYARFGRKRLATWFAQLVPSTIRRGHSLVTPVTVRLLHAKSKTSPRQHQIA